MFRILIVDDHPVVRSGYLRLLSRELLRNLRAGGYETLRSTYVERKNPASAAQYRAMGGRPLHGYAFYDKGI